MGRARSFPAAWAPLVAMGIVCASCSSSDEEPGPSAGAGGNAGSSSSSYPVLAGADSACSTCLASLGGNACKSAVDDCRGEPACLELGRCWDACVGVADYGACVSACGSSSATFARAQAALRCACCSSGCSATSCSSSCAPFRDPVYGPLGAGCDP